MFRRAWNGLFVDNTLKLQNMHIKNPVTFEFLVFVAMQKE